MPSTAELMQKAKDEIAADRAARYTPQMVLALRNAVLEAKMNALMGQGMKVVQARINAEMQLEAWENHELSK